MISLVMSIPARTASLNSKLKTLCPPTHPKTNITKLSRSILGANEPICGSAVHAYDKVTFRFSLKSARVAMDKFIWHKKRIPGRCAL